MPIVQLFRSFIPLRNPIGFGAVDFILFAVTGLLVLIVLLWPVAQPFAHRLATRTASCMTVLGLLPILLRLLLLPHSPVPTPSGSDDFSFLLLADTLAHFRLANPAHPMHRFFETLFVMQQPTYSSMYPLGQGIVLALGQLLFAHPWAGVLLATGAFCALCYWALLAWLPAEWALLGGLLAVFQFGPLSYWMNSYWGGALSACAGCLVFGSLPRLCDTARRRHAIWLGTGLAIQLLTRPFEVTLLVLSVALFFVFSSRVPGVWRKLVRILPATLLTLLPALALTLLQNRAVTGSWTTLPYLLNRYEYGVPATFTWQSNPVPHRPLTPDEDLNYRAQSAIHEDVPETPRRFFERFAYRVRYYRFFLLAPLFLGVAAFILSVRNIRDLWVLATILLFLVGSNFYPFFFPHYIAAAACLFLLAAVSGLRKIAQAHKPPGYPLAPALKESGTAADLPSTGESVVRSSSKVSWLRGGTVAQIVILLCIAHFLFWYGVHLLAGNGIAAALASSESWDFLNYGDPEGRIAIDDRLLHSPGRLLVFVRYSAGHGFHNWIHNAAGIDSSRVVLARDLGPAENEQLRRYYPDRTVWLLEPDAQPPRLTPFPSARHAIAPRTARFESYRAASLSSLHRCPRAMDRPAEQSELYRRCTMAHPAGPLPKSTTVGIAAPENTTRGWYGRRG